MICSITCKKTNATGQVANITLMPRNVFSRRFGLANGRTSHIMTLLSMELDKRWLPSGLSERPAIQHVAVGEGNVGRIAGLSVSFMAPCTRFNLHDQATKKNCMLKAELGYCLH